MWVALSLPPGLGGIGITSPLGRWQRKKRVAWRHWERSLACSDGLSGSAAPSSADENPQMLWVHRFKTRISTEGVTCGKPSEVKS